MNTENNLETTIEWKKINYVRHSAFKESYIIFLTTFIILGILSFIGFIPLKAIIVLYIILIPLFMFYYIGGNQLIRYTFVSELSIKDDRIIYKTAGNLLFEALYENFGLIVDIEGFGTPHNIRYVVPSVEIVYYNPKYGKCFEITVDKKSGKEIIKRYKKYCDERGLKYCPIIEGVLESSNPIYLSKNNLKYSSFCNRKRLNRYNYEERHIDIPPPPWLKEGDKNGK